MIKVGDIVILDRVAFDYAGIDFTSEKTGIVLSVESARESFNLDTDDLLCSVMMPSGKISLFYEEDLRII